MSELLNCPFCGKPPKPVGDGLVSCANFMCAIVAVTFTPELWNRRQPIDAATIRELLPVAKVVDNNQPGWRVVVEVAPHTTLSLGTMLYLESDVRALTQNAAAPDFMAQLETTIAWLVGQLPNDPMEEPNDKELLIAQAADCLKRVSYLTNAAATQEDKDA